MAKHQCGFYLSYLFIVTYILNYNQAETSHGEDTVFRILEIYTMR